MNLNKAMIIGNLTRDPEVRTTPQGQPVASFSVATNQVWTDQSGQRQERAEYHNIVAWRKLAEIVGQYLKRGSKVYIEGRLQTREWEGQDGQKRYKTEIVADNMIMLDGRSSGSSQKPNFASTATPQSHDLPTIQADAPALSGDDEIHIEDIPF